MGMDMNRLMQQATQMQEQIAEKLKTQLAEPGTAGGGAVSVTANGAGEIVEVKIDPKALDDAEYLADMVLAATNAALANAQSLATAQQGDVIGDMMRGLGLGF